MHIKQVIKDLLTKANRLQFVAFIVKHYITDLPLDCKNQEELANDLVMTLITNNGSVLTPQELLARYKIYFEPHPSKKIGTIIKRTLLHLYFTGKTQNNIKVVDFIYINKINKRNKKIQKKLEFIKDKNK